MTIKDEIERIEGNVGASLDALTAKGVNVPEGANSNDLATLIAAVPTGGGGGGVQSDWLVNDESDPAYIRNRPFWSSEPVETVVVSEQTIEVMDIGDGAYLGFTTAEAELVSGSVYTVELNGVSYEFACVEFDGVAILGNPAPLGFADDSGDPFGCALMWGDFVFQTMPGAMDLSSGTAVLKVYGVQVDLVKIDAKYIPDLGLVGKPGKGVNAEVFNGDSCSATGYNSHAEGDGTTAAGWTAHSEGYDTQALANHSHAEGQNTVTTGAASHAEGMDTVAAGAQSHAEGLGCNAAGWCAHAEGLRTYAAADYQHVQGRYNITDTAKAYAHIVGNGSDGKPSNAHTLDWLGNAWYAGSVEGTALILKSPDGSRFKVTVSNAGALTATKL